MPVWRCAERDGQQADFVYCDDGEAGHEEPRDACPEQRLGGNVAALWLPRGLRDDGSGHRCPGPAVRHAPKMRSHEGVRRSGPEVGGAVCSVSDEGPGTAGDQAAITGRPTCGWVSAVVAAARFPRLRRGVRWSSRIARRAWSRARTAASTASAATSTAAWATPIFQGLPSRSAKARRAAAVSAASKAAWRARSRRSRRRCSSRTQAWCTISSAAHTAWSGSTGCVPAAVCESVNRRRPNITGLPSAAGGTLPAAFSAQREVRDRGSDGGGRAMALPSCPPCGRGGQRGGSRDRRGV
jgi:hypothetical protein